MSLLVLAVTQGGLQSSLGAPKKWVHDNSEPGMEGSVKRVGKKDDSLGFRSEVIAM